ncbi:MAG TPA: hypothetical protein PLY87_13215 [Planctomycetaceae bacterium]|nr:hypothetical protein [Planctomycetaceae bacterium]HQZ66039.1 hypothetical protein [Planctomycetaceae bacterium]
MKRIDSGHSQPSHPHPVHIPSDRLQELLDLLENREISLAEFAAKVTAYPAIHKRIMIAANSAAAGRLFDIRDPIHAAAYLGSLRLTQLLKNLPVGSFEIVRGNETWRTAENTG